MTHFQALLMLIAVACFWWAYRVERELNNNFSWLDMLRDENGKPSFLRLAIPLAGLSSTIVLFYVVSHNDPEDLQFYLYYLIFWSGAPVAGKALDAAVNIWGKK